MKKEPTTSGYLELEHEIRLYYQYYAQTAAQHALANETLVFIHAHSVDCRMWEPQIKHFAPQYALLCYDLRGYGKSSLPREAQPFLHADDLRALLDYLDIEAVHLIGLSLGSFVALDFLAQYPERVRSVTVASGAIPDPKPEVLPPLVTDVPSFKQAWFARLLEGCGEDQNGYTERLWEMIDDWKAWQATHREEDCTLGEAVLSRLLALQTPHQVCVVKGEDDFEGAHHSAERLLNAMPHAVRGELPKAGHFSNMETPDAFNHALQTFLEHRREQS